MAKSEPEVAQDQAEFAEISVLRALPQIGVQRRKERGFVRHEGIVQPAKLGAAELQRARRAALEEGALTLHGGGKVHNRIGESSPAGYNFVK
jgi:hypothetical protein